MAAWYGGSFNVGKDGGGPTEGGDAGTMTAQFFVSGDIGSDLYLSLQVKTSGSYTHSNVTNAYYPNMLLKVSIDGAAYTTNTSNTSQGTWLDSAFPRHRCYPSSGLGSSYHKVTLADGSTQWKYNVGKARIVKIQPINTIKDNGAPSPNNASYENPNADFRGILFMGAPTTSYYEISTATRTIYINNVRIYYNGGWNFCVPYVYSNGWKNAYTYVYNGTAWKDCRS